MRYFYLLHYSYERPHSAIRNHAQMYIMGDKYDIPDLRNIAAGEFALFCELITKIFRRGLEEPAGTYFKTFWNMVCLVYKSLPEADATLRKPLAGAFASYIVMSPQLVTTDEYRFCCLQYPFFGLDMQMEILFPGQAVKPDCSVGKEWGLEWWLSSSNRGHRVATKQGCLW